MAADRVDSISADRFAELLECYDKSIFLQDLSPLNVERFEAIPRQVQQRGDGQHVTKMELTTLVEWKLTHGKFRPTPKGLIAQNTTDDIVEASKAGYEAFRDTSQARHVRITKALSSLTKLKGVGPATASLLLSVAQPEDVIFFSDELYWWTTCQILGQKTHGLSSNNPKYNMKEYLDIDAEISKLRQRLKVSCSDIEKVAYVLRRLVYPEKVKYQLSKLHDVLEDKDLSKYGAHKRNPHGTNPYQEKKENLKRAHHAMNDETIVDNALAKRRNPRRNLGSQK